MQAEQELPVEPQQLRGLLGPRTLHRSPVLRVLRARLGSAGGYRQGNWYGAIKGRGILRFTSIRFDGANLQVALDKPAHLQVITKCGITAWGNSNKMSFSVAAADREKYGYLRVRAYARDGSEEIIFSQPMMLT